MLKVDGEIRQVEDVSSCRGCVGQFFFFFFFLWSLNFIVFFFFVVVFFLLCLFYLFYFSSFFFFFFFFFFCFFFFFACTSWFDIVCSMPCGGYTNGDFLSVKKVSIPLFFNTLYPFSILESCVPFLLSSTFERFLVW